MSVVIHIFIIHITLHVYFTLFTFVFLMKLRYNFLYLFFFCLSCSQENDKHVINEWIWAIYCNISCEKITISKIYFKFLLTLYKLNKVIESIILILNYEHDDQILFRTITKKMYKEITKINFYSAFWAYCSNTHK